MFDTVILLAGPAEQVAMPPVLREHHPHLTVISVGSSGDLAALSSDLLGRARLIAFLTPEIVSTSILARLGYGAFNFHPGPPGYPRMGAFAFCALRAGGGVRCDGPCDGRASRRRSDHRGRAVSNPGRHFPFSARRD